jgi:hypothetical protein
MLGIRGAAATRRASTGCSMTVDNTLLPYDGRWGFGVRTGTGRDDGMSQSVYTKVE